MIHNDTDDKKPVNSDLGSRAGSVSNSEIVIMDDNHKLIYLLVMHSI